MVTVIFTQKLEFVVPLVILKPRFRIHDEMILFTRRSTGAASLMMLLAGRLDGFILIHATFVGLCRWWFLDADAPISGSVLPFMGCCIWIN